MENKDSNMFAFKTTLHLETDNKLESFGRCGFITLIKMLPLWHPAGNQHAELFSWKFIGVSVAAVTEEEKQIQFANFEISQVDHA